GADVDERGLGSVQDDVGPVGGGTQPTIARGPPSKAARAMRDIRYALRVLRRSPGFAAIAVLSLALGIGANTAGLRVSWAFFSEPLAIAHPERLFAVANQLRIPPGMGGTSQINGTFYRDPASGRSYRALMPFPSYLAVRDAAAKDADVFAFTFVREANISVDGWSTTRAGALGSGHDLTAH